METRAGARSAAGGRAAGRRGGGRQRDTERTRAALLRAAAELFSEHGYDGVPIEDVAARAGVNKALISYHFHGKRGLYVALLSSVFSEMADRLKAIEAAGGGAAQTLHGLLAAFAQLRVERPDFPVLFLREVLARGLEPAVAPHLVEIVGVTRRLAERGAREGVFRRVDPFVMHLALVGSLVFFFATEKARQRASAAGQIPFPMPEAEKFIRYLEDLTLRGLAPSSTPSRRKGARA